MHSAATFLFSTIVMGSKNLITWNRGKGKWNQAVKKKTVNNSRMDKRHGLYSIPYDKM